MASHAVAEEVAQDTWLAVIKGIRGFEGRSSLKTWLFRILVNQARKRGAREHRIIPMSSLGTDGSDGDAPAVDPDRFVSDGQRWAGHWCAPPVPWTDLPAERLIGKESVAVVVSAIEKLPDRQREVVTLRRGGLDRRRGLRAARRQRGQPAGAAPPGPIAGARQVRNPPRRGKVRAWPLVTLRHHVVDYAVQGELASALIGELQAAYVRLPQRRREVLLGLINSYSEAASIIKALGGRGLPGLAVRAVQQCAEALDEVVWQGYAAWARGSMTGQLDRAGQYRRSVAAAETLTGKLDSGDAVQACGMLHLSAGWAAGARGDHDTSAIHLREASVLAARMDTEVGTWANLWFGPTNVGIWKTSLAVELGEHGQALEIAKTVHPELLPNRRQAEFWSQVGCALVAGKKTRHKGVHVLLHAEHLAPQRIHTDLLVRETVADLLRQVRREAGGRELRGLAWRMGIVPLG